MYRGKRSAEVLYIFTYKFYKSFLFFFISSLFTTAQNSFIFFLTTFSRTSSLSLISQSFLKTTKEVERNLIAFLQNALQKKVFKKLDCMFESFVEHMRKEEFYFLKKNCKR